MSISNAEETAPSIPEETTPLAKPKRIWWILGGIVFVLLLTAGGSYLGYQTAIEMRLNQQDQQVALEATTQYQLSLEDIAAKRFDIARLRLEHVIKVDPNFPGALDKLTEVMYLSSITATPTQAPTPTLTPTPDIRGEEDLFNQVKQDLAEKKWSEAIDEMDTLRAKNLQYRAIEVDGMYYVALRNRGSDRILKEGKLQEGMYDLSLAERFGPLDGDANGYRTWANLYLTGAAYWKVDWEKVLSYFTDIYVSYPGLRDASGMTATERYRQANIGYGDKLASAGKDCEAAKKYEEALRISPDTAVETKRNDTANRCSSANASPTESSTTEAPTATTDPNNNQQPTVTTEPPAATTEPPTATPEPPTPEPAPTEAAPTPGTTG